MHRTELDPNLKQAIQVGTPVELFDTATNQVFYLLSAEQYRSINAGDTFDPREAYPTIERLMADDDAHDPLLDSYQ
ncbi:MAG: hypothetical protein C0485_15060 [Pirellula sp.]|nr:hypothetical protein [Pirellula sp.]